MADSEALPHQSARDRPHVERTPFDPIEPPPRITLWYCPACGRRITKDYGVEPARKSCTSRWHLTAAVEVKYERLADA